MVVITIKKHEKEILQAQLDSEKAVLKELEKHYKQALTDIDEKLAALLGRQDADMQHVIFQVQYQKALKAQVEGILNQLHANEFETISEYLTACYEEGFLGTLYSLQKQGVPLAFPIDQRQVVEAVQTESKISEGLYTRLGKDVKKLKKDISSEITRGISSSMTYGEISRNLDSKAQIGMNRAMRITRTEGGRISNKAAMDTMQKAQKAGADVVKKWSSTLDGATRPSHSRLDGQIREVDKPFSNGLMYPSDPAGPASEIINCRCKAQEVARWALDADETKYLGDTDGMTDDQLRPLANKLNISVDELRKYKNQIIPVKASSYEDFRRQYNQIWNATTVPDKAKDFEEYKEKYKKAVDNKKESGIMKSFNIGKSIGSAAKNYPVRMPGSKQHVKIAEGQSIEGTVFAGFGTDKEIRDKRKIEAIYKLPASKLQKVSGKGFVIVDGKQRKAELHWYEADGEKADFKIKRFLDED